MTSSRSTQPLTDREIDELDDALADLRRHRGILDASMLDGFLVGVLLQPEPVMPSAWLPVLFEAREGEPMIPGDLDRVQRVTDLVMRHHNTLAAHIAARVPFDPIVYEIPGDEGDDVQQADPFLPLWPWATGFVVALGAFPALVERYGDDPDVDAALVNVTRHFRADPSDTSEAALQVARDRERFDREIPLEDLDDAIGQLLLGVLEIADITRPRRPVERAHPKVGRNDPCPCGSGRKYKQCHGREAQ